ncbi:MAG: molybdopterin-dependent oxidoreductase [Desulfovibrio sp.]|nr:molybdopterin-dependent oxidoreductase [Desulfovibrio sp.]
MQRTICYMCSSECGLLVSAGPGGLVLEGDPRHPVNRGKICPKLALAEALRRHPKRLTSPLKRVGARGEGRFAPCSWDEACGLCGKALQDLARDFGPESLAVLFGEKPDHDMVYDFAGLFGTPNVLDHNSLCDASRRLAFAGVYGRGQERPLPDLARPLLAGSIAGKAGDAGRNGAELRFRHDCRLLVLFGENPAEATRFRWLWEGIRQAQKAGMKLVVVDPCRTGTARAADLWLPARPGSDAAILLCLLAQVLADPAALDMAFIARHGRRFAELRDLVLARRLDPASGLAVGSLPWACQKADLPLEAMEALVRDVKAIRPFCAMAGMNGVAHSPDGFLACETLAVLIAVCGCLDVPGGLVLRGSLPLASPKARLERALGEARFLHKDIYGAYPGAAHGVFARIPRDVEEGVQLVRGPFAGRRYALRGLVCVHGNPLLTAPESGAWRRMLLAREGAGYLLRHVSVHATVLNETARFADLVFPMAHFLERQGVCLHETPAPAVGLREAVAEPPKGVLRPLEVWKKLARACVPGPAPHSPLPGALGACCDDEWCNALLAPLAAFGGQGDLFEGRTPCDWLRSQGGFAEWPCLYRKYERDGFGTPDGKIDLAPASLIRFYAALDAGQEHGVAACPLASANDPASGEDASLEGAPDGTAGSAPFLLVTGRSPLHTHTATQDCYPRESSARSLRLLVNVHDARRLGLVRDAWVRLRGGRGASVAARVLPTPDLRPGLLRCQHGWGTDPSLLAHPLDGSFNVNELTLAERFDPWTGNAWFGCMEVFLESLPAGGEARPEAGDRGQEARSQADQGQAR